MSVRFNLASHPYENLRPSYVLAAVGIVLLVVLAGFLVSREQQQSAETRSITRQMARFEQEVESLASEQSELDEWLRRPEVQEIRDHSAFLNSLILRKSLSWTQMFLDLEQILPDRAQVTAIQPRVNRSQQPGLALAVTAEEMGPLVELLKNLESSSQFGSPTVLSQRFTADRNSVPQVEMTLQTSYRQVLPEPETDDPVSDPAVASEAAPSPLEVAEVGAQDEPTLARREGGL